MRGILPPRVGCLLASLFRDGAGVPGSGMQQPRGRGKVIDGQMEAP
ncbi:MAG: hypothetical protein RLZZ165_1389, partial [Bacteroidota bacterium]